MGVRSTGQPEIIVDTEAERDLTWPANTEVFCLDTSKAYVLSGGAWVQKSIASGGGGAAWGSITGVLANQSDLQALLNTKTTKAVAVAMAVALG